MQPHSAIKLYLGSFIQQDNDLQSECLAGFRYCEFGSEPDIMIYRE